MDRILNNIDAALQTRAYRLIETMLSNGHNWDTLPISPERVREITQGAVFATAEDVSLLERAAGPTIQN